MKKIILSVKTKIYFHKNFLLKILSSYSTMLLGGLFFIITTPILLKSLGETQYSLWILLNNLIIFLTLSNFGYNTTFSTGLNKNSIDDQTKKKFINTILFTVLAIPLLIGVLALLSFDHIQHLLNIPDELKFKALNTFLVLNLILVVNVIYSFIDNILYISDSIIIKNVWETLKLILINSLIIIYSFFKIDLVNLSLLILVSTLVFTLLFYYKTKKIYSYEINIKYFSIKVLKESFLPSFHFFLINVASYIVFYSDTLMVSGLAGITYVAMYSTKYKVIDVVQRLIFKISDVKFPSISELSTLKDYVALKALHSRLLKYTIILVVPIAIFLSFTGKFFFKIWLGGDYWFDNGVFTLMLIGMILTCTIHVTSLFIINLGTHKYVSYMSILESILNLIFSYFFFRFFGIIGIPMGTVVSIILTNGWYVVYNFNSHINKFILIK